MSHNTDPASHSFDCQCPKCLNRRIEHAMETVCSLLVEIHRLNGLKVKVRHMGRPDSGADFEIFRYTFVPCGHILLERTPVEVAHEGLSPTLYGNCPDCWQLLEEQSPIDSHLLRALKAEGLGRYNSQAAEHLARLLSIIRQQSLATGRIDRDDGTVWLKSSIKKLRENSHWLLSEWAIGRALKNGKSLGIILTRSAGKGETLFRLDYDRINTLRESVSETHVPSQAQRTPECRTAPERSTGTRSQQPDPTPSRRTES